MHDREMQWKTFREDRANKEVLSLLCIPRGTVEALALTLFP